MKWLIRSLIGLGLLVALILIPVIALFVTTSGEYIVPDTVTTDPSLPNITLNGVTFHTETFGDPADPTVVVVHGGPGGSYGYLMNLHELSDDYHVVFYDQRGAGLSPRVPAEELSLETSIEDLHRIVTYYGDGEPVHIIGHSWGAMLTAAYLGRYPDMVDKAVLAEPGGLDNESFARFQEVQASTQTGGAYYRVLVPTIFESIHIDPPDAEAQNDYIYGVMTYAFVDHPASGYRCQDVDVEEVKPNIEVPPFRLGATSLTSIFSDSFDLSNVGSQAANFENEVLFLAGTCSTLLGEEFQRTQMAFFPNARLVMIPNAGHEMFGDNPSDSLAAVRTYFSE